MDYKQHLLILLESLHLNLEHEELNRMEKLKIWEKIKKIEKELDALHE